LIAAVEGSALSLAFGSFVFYGGIFASCQHGWLPTRRCFRARIRPVATAAIPAATFSERRRLKRRVVAASDILILPENLPIRTSVNPGAIGRFSHARLSIRQGFTEDRIPRTGFGLVKIPFPAIFEFGSGKRNAAWE